MVKIKQSNISDEVVAWVIDALHRGQFNYGDKLPSIDQIAEELDVGRSTVREAWSHLQALNIIQIIHGKGSFIAHPKLPIVTSPIGFSRAILERGMKPGSVLLKREVQPASDVVAKALNLQPGEKVNILHRLRLADDIPMAIQVSYTSYQQFHDLLDLPWLLNTSLYTKLAENYQTEIASAQHKIRVSLINQEQAQLLQVRPGSAALELDTIAFTLTGAPVEFGQDIYRGDRFQYSITLARKT